MASHQQLAPTATDPDLYTVIQRFYATQMQLLDRGATAEWAMTFTDDGVFGTNVDAEPARGRAEIAAGAQEAVDRLAADRVIHRHWLGMLDITIDPDDPAVLRARSYALVIRTPLGGTPVIWRSCVCEDVLVAHADQWWVRTRQVTRDDLPAKP